MKMPRQARAAAAAGMAATLVLSGCATPSVAPSAQAGRSPAVKIDPQLEAQASAFESFVRRAQAIDPAFSGPAEVSAAVQTGAAYEPLQMQAGMVAFAAVAALQDPAFVAAVRRQARDPSAARALQRSLLTSPDAAIALPGADGAAARARGALFRQGAALADGGRRVKAASYSVQRQAWAKARVSNAPARLTRVKAMARVAYRPSGQDQSMLYQAVATGGGRGGRASPVVARGVALAALSVMGDSRSGASLLSEPRNAMCVRMAKLNYHQCLASAGPYYEDVYCLGVHAMSETAQCVAAAAGAAPSGGRRS